MIEGDTDAARAGERSDRARRKTSDERRSDILRAAVDLIVETRSLPLSMNAIGDRIGASRALVYAHFSDQAAIIEAIMVDYLGRLDATGIDAAMRHGDVVERGTRSAALYLQHIAEHGPVIHVILRDVPHGVTLPASVTAPRNRALRALAGAARKQLRLTSAEAIVLVELLIAIPEELGRLVHAGELELRDGLAICQRLIRSGIDAMRPG